MKQTIIIFLSVLSLILVGLGDVYAIQIHAIESSDATGRLIEKSYDNKSKYNKFSSLKEELDSYLRRGLYDQVLKEISKMSEKKAAEISFVTIRIAALVGKKKIAQAEVELTHLLNRPDLAEESVVVIAGMYLKIRKPVRALSVCQRGLLYVPQPYRLFFTMGKACLLNRRADLAIIYFKRTAFLNKKRKLIPSGLLNTLIVSAYLNLQQYDKAMEVYKNSNDIKTGSLLEVIVKAKYFASIGDVRQSLDVLDQGIRELRNPTILVLKSQVLLQTGKPEAALAILSGVAEEGPFLAQRIALARSLSCLLNKAPEKALSYLTSIKHDGKKPKNYNLIEAIVYVSLGDKESAVKLLKRAPMPLAEIATHKSLIRHMESPEIGPVIGQAYFCFDQGYFGQAVKMASQVITDGSDNLFMHLLLAESFRNMKEYDNALSEYRYLTKIMPESFALRFQFAKTLEDAGKLDEATQEYERLLQDRPNFRLVQLSFGQLLKRRGYWLKAKKMYELSLSFNPEEVSLLTGLAWSLCHLDDLDALASIIDTLRSNKRTPPATILHLEGWALYKQEDFKKATVRLSEALKILPGDPELCFHLGMAFWSLGESQKAVNLMKQVELFPEYQERYNKQILDIINQQAK